MTQYLVKDLGGKALFVLDADSLDDAVVGKKKLERMSRDPHAVFLLPEATPMELREFFANDWCGKAFHMPL